MAMMRLEVTGQMPTWGDSFLHRLKMANFNRHWPVFATLVMVLLLAKSLAMLTWELLPQPEVDEVNNVSSNGANLPGTQDQSRQYKLQIGQISQWHLFGEVQKVVPKTVAKVTDAPDTRLNLKLHGVLASSDPVLARAIIADGKGTEETYAVGKNLPGNAVLREIYADRVILEYRGRLETLRLPKDAALSLGADLPSKNSQIRGRGFSPRPSGSTSSVGAGSVTNTQTSALLRQYREALVSDPQSLMNLVAAAPVTEGGTGKLKGYRIRPGKDKTLLGKFGLQNGDVVTAVNGVPLDNPIKALEIMRDLSTASSVSVDIERKGVTQSLSFQVD